MHQKAVPVCLRHEMMHNYHVVSLCHAETDRCVMALRRHYFWHSMSRDIKKYIKECKDCQEGKSYHRYKALLKPLSIPNRCGQTFHIGHVGPIKAGPNGERYIFTVIDSYLTWVWLFPVHNTNSEVAAQCMHRLNN